MYFCLQNVSSVEKTIAMVEDENEVQLFESKTELLSDSPKKIKIKKQCGNILPKKVKMADKQSSATRADVAQEKSAKRKASLADLEVQPPLLNGPGTSKKKPKVDNQTLSVSNYHLSETGLQTVSRNDNLDSFLGYMASILRKFPLKKSLDVQGKLISCILQECASSDELSDASLISD